MSELQPIRLKHMALTMPQYLTIRNYTNNNGDVEVDSLYRDPLTISADFLHSKQTMERIAKNNATTLTCHLLSKGVKIKFMDGEKSESVIAKLSPPLYDKHYRK
jgi:hypothetical protein